MTRSADGTAAEVAEVIRTLARSSRALIRQARARYTSDLLKRPHRAEFDSIWQTVQWVPGWFHEGSAVVLHELMRAAPPRTVVEIGSYLGRSTVFFGLAMKELNPEGRVVAIDPHTGDLQQLDGLATERLATFDLFRQHCCAAGVESLVEAHVASSLEVVTGWSDPIDVLYVDGWHSYDAVIADGEAWLPHLSPRGVVIFDDYAEYEEVREAVGDLVTRGIFCLWGSIFGQAIGGPGTEPPAAIKRSLRLSGAQLQRTLSDRRHLLSRTR